MVKGLAKGRGQSSRFFLAQKLLIINAGPLHLICLQARLT